MRTAGERAARSVRLALDLWYWSKTGRCPNTHCPSLPRPSPHRPRIAATTTHNHPPPPWTWPARWAPLLPRDPAPATLSSVGIGPPLVTAVVDLQPAANGGAAVTTCFVSLRWSRQAFRSTIDGGINRKRWFATKNDPQSSKRPTHGAMGPFHHHGLGVS
jgi:hypothetical protein